MLRGFRILLHAGASITALLPGVARAQVVQPPQPAASGSSPDPSDIIVTARRVEERLQDVPISITVFNQQQVANRNMVNAQDLATYTPSLSANGNYGPDNTSFAIRGFVQDQNTAPSVGVYFADVVALRGPSGAGTQAGDSAGPGDFFDIQNIQVLKGPQGTLQGRNTTGGAVLFVPQKPTDKTEGYLEGSYGNYNMWRIQAMLNVPLGDTARFRIAMDHQDRDGWLHNTSAIGPSAFNNLNYTAVRASLVADLTPNLENYMIASYSRSSTNGGDSKLIGCNATGATANPLTNFPAYEAGIGNFLGLLSCGQLAREKASGAGFYDVENAFPNPLSQVVQWQVINRTTWKESDDLTITNIASYGQFTDQQRSPLYGTNFQVTDLPPQYQPVFRFGVPPVFVPINSTPYIADQYTLTEELRAQGSALDSKLTYQGGFYFESSKPLGRSGSISNQVLACPDIAARQCTDLIGEAFGTPVGALNVTSSAVSFRDVGVYAQVNYALTTKLKLTAGARYTWDKEDANSVRYYYHFNTAVTTLQCANPAQDPTCSESLQQKSHKPTWLIDLDYKPIRDVLIYGKYARGYRAGGLAINGPEGFQAFSPEKVDSYEGGVKTNFGGALHGTFNLAGFYNNFTNQQIQLGFNANPNYAINPLTGGAVAAPVSPTASIVNLGKSRIYGAEVETSITPFAGFSIDGAYTYLNATIRSIRPFGTAPTADNLYVPAAADIPSGTPLVLSPKNKFTVTGAYTLPLDISIGKITVAATFTHTDKMLTNYQYLNPAAVALFGQNFGYIGKSDLLNLNLNWNNIAGKPVDLSLFATNVTQKHYYIFIAGLGGLNGAGNEFASLGEPRMFGARLRVRFGS